MRLIPFALCCAMLYLPGNQALGEHLDPFGTEDNLPLTPSIRLGGAVGDPCAIALPDRALEIAEVVNHALCSNPQTREIWASARVQAAQLGSSKGSYLPNLDASVSGKRNTGEGRQRRIDLSLSYLLYDFGQRAANLESAQQSFAAAIASQDATLQSLFFSAVQGHYQVLAAQAALDAARESEHAAERSHAAAEARHFAGSATPADKLQAHTAWSQAVLNRITAEGTLKKAQGYLATLLGQEASRRIELAPAAADTPPESFERDVSTLIEAARRNRPELIAAEAQLKAAEAGADAARAAGKPSISLTASNSRTDSAGSTSRGSSLGVSVSVPLFAGFAPTYRVRAAEAQIEARQAQKERVQLQIALDVWNAYQNLFTATQSLRTSFSLLQSAEQSERVARGRYQAGVGSILDVLNAQSALASARQQRIQSTLDWNVGRAALAQSMGSLNADLLQTLSPAATGNISP